MSTWEEITALTTGVPTGYVVTYHERRGYDSPDRWYSATTKRGRMIGEFSTGADAIKACKSDKRKR